MGNRVLRILSPNENEAGRVSNEISNNEIFLKEVTVRHHEYARKPVFVKYNIFKRGEYFIYRKTVHWPAE